MRNLFIFILRNSHWLLAILLVGCSFYLVFSQNAYQHSVYLSSANRVTGWFYQVSGEVRSFFYLKKNNRLLSEENAALSRELLALREQMNRLTVTDSYGRDVFAADTSIPLQFDFIPAKVTNLSLAGRHNFITLDKGASDGIRADMGVVSPNGIVGVVSLVSPNFSIVLPVINHKFRLSAKLKNSENYGSIAWDGNNIHEAQLQELPKHETFHEGDTVLTSFSRIFPKNLIIGTVIGQGRSKDDLFNTFKIRLATDFYTLQEVWVINDRYHDEQTALEERSKQ